MHDAHGVVESRTEAETDWNYKRVVADSEVGGKEEALEASGSRMPSQALYIAVSYILDGRNHGK
jgi:hypothetical protein